MLKLRLQYFGHLMQRVDSLEKTLMLGGSKGFCGHMSLVPSKPRSVIRVRGPGRLSVFKRCVSAFGRSQSLALHLPVVLFFL